jgi:hypothetical protein
MMDAYVDGLRIVRPIGLRGALECVSPSDKRRWLVRLPLAHRAGATLGALVPIETHHELAEWARERRDMLSKQRVDTMGPHMLREFHLDERVPALLCAPTDRTLKEMRAPLPMRLQVRLARHLGTAIDFVWKRHAPLAHASVVAENVFFCVRTGAFLLGGGPLGPAAACVRQLAALLRAYGAKRMVDAIEDVEEDDAALERVYACGLRAYLSAVI